MLADVSPIPRAADNRPVIGLTGGIGAGKSTVAAILESLGCLVSKSDELAREALRDPQIRATIMKWWGAQILDAQGEIDRGAVARIVFHDQAERARLESLTHPWIERKRREAFAAAPPGTVAYVIDAPLLLEAGLERECDAVIFVDAPREVRLQRVRGTRGWDEAELQRREDSQLPLDVKRRRADYIVVNDRDRSALSGEVESMLRQILDGFAIKGSRIPSIPPNTEA